MIDIVFRRIVTMLDNARISKNHRMVGNVTVNIGVRRDQHIISNRNITYDSNIHTDPNLIPYRRYAFARASVFLSYRHTLVQIAIIADNCSWIDGNIVHMTQV